LIHAAIHSSDESKGAKAMQLGQGGLQQGMLGFYSKHHDATRSTCSLGFEWRQDSAARFARLEQIATPRAIALCMGTGGRPPAW
jgi:hypothetical protein